MAGAAASGAASGAAADVATSSGFLTASTYGATASSSSTAKGVSSATYPMVTLLLLSSPDVPMVSRSASRACVMSSSKLKSANDSKCFSRYVRPACERAPIAMPKYSKYCPDGFVSYRWGPVASAPATSNPTPYGRCPMRCVPICDLSATLRTSLPTCIGSSYTYLWLMHSVRMYLASTRASATRPAMAMPILSSILKTFF
mmetsp:Transcript_9102/g.30166  ORF Transcript_9102/g.30166 Transcript_9102/m.30166 type:complete len:201 (+) Transcript_9102:642-1244(+)